MATYRHWSVSLWRDPDDVSHCRILSPDKTEWRLISATLCGWRRCFMADQLWLMTRIREEEVIWLRPRLPRLLALASTTRPFSFSIGRPFNEAAKSFLRLLPLMPPAWCSSMPMAPFFSSDDDGKPVARNFPLGNSMPRTRGSSVAHLPIISCSKFWSTHVSQDTLNLISTSIYVVPFISADSMLWPTHMSALPALRGSSLPKPTAVSTWKWNLQILYLSGVADVVNADTTTLHSHHIIITEHRGPPIRHTKINKELHRSAVTRDCGWFSHHTVVRHTRNETVSFTITCTSWNTSINTHNSTMVFTVQTNKVYTYNMIPVPD